jgi:antirestriction protein
MATLEEVLEYDRENYYGEGYREGALTVFYNNSPSYHAGLDADEIVDAFTDAYLGEYDSLEDYAVELLDGQITLPDNLAYYFDYKSFARDLEMGGDVWFDAPYLFSAH